MSACGKHLHEHRTEVSGTRLHTVHGSADGPPVVVVPGFVVGVRYLLPAVRCLGEFADTHAIDLLGHGSSPGPPHAFGVPEQAESVAAWMRAQLSEPAVLAGHSLGGQVILRLAADHPELVRGLVLLDPSVMPWANPLGLGRRLLVDLPRERPVVTWREIVDVFRTSLPTAVREVITAFRQPEAELLQRVHVPTVVVRGERDPLLTPRWARRIAHLLPNARLEVLPGEPHVTVDAAPDKVAGVVRALLDETREGRPHADAG